MNSKKFGIASVVVLLLAGVSLGMYYGFREDPKLTAVRNLGAQLRDDSIPREQKREMFGQFREAMEQLTPEQRDKLRAESGRDRSFGPPQKEIDAFFAMPKKDQIAQIDKQIDQMEKWRKDREKRDRERAAEQAKGGSGGGPGGAGGAGGANGRGGPGGGNYNGGNQRGGGNPSDRAQQRRLALDNGSPQQRAQRTEMFRMMNDRRQQRGLPPMTGGGGRGRG